ncbi:DUF805 domain-containing protein [Streptomyces sp. CHD11]|uniref:DUF805 domain-containing protein n=1 Tax=Streptomyces sp. CHD11 TaxID=2741325 RepID=UPI001BFC7981|nr:DUF805 domain-containing protein [Streptomyces sp. CHD11]MBT3153223.1 DUF805 domain-containing protein [Streptomyces sp. CHD11]
MNYYLDVIKKYAVFTGRARRQEYWMFALFNVGIVLVLSIIDMVALGANVLVPLYSLAVLLPNLGVTVRRLHDTGRSGWWCLIALVPVVGVIVLIVFLATEGNQAGDKYGPNPKYVPTA